MRKVQRSELLGLGPYEEIRDRFRARVIAQKRRRRITPGDNMSLVFENHDTMLMQIQEMLRTERISDERAVSHELDTYNELVPGEGELSATLFLEYEDPQERRIMLEKLATLRDSVVLQIGDQRSVARFATHFGEEFERLPAVNYLMFQVGRAAAAQLLDPACPAALEIAHPDYAVRVPLTRDMREELAHDLTAESL